jgi:hypothetical protein
MKLETHMIRFVLSATAVLVLLAGAAVAFAAPQNTLPSSAACPRDGEAAEQVDSRQVACPGPPLTYGVEATYSHLHTEAPFLVRHTFTLSTCR